MEVCHALGMSDEEICSAERIPAALAYSAFVAWLALDGSDAELAAALGVKFLGMGRQLRPNERGAEEPLWP